MINMFKLEQATKKNIVKLGILAIIPILTFPWFFLLCGYTVDMFGQLTGRSYVKVNEDLFISNQPTFLFLIAFIGFIALIVKAIRTNFLTLLMLLFVYSLPFLFFISFIFGFDMQYMVREEELNFQNVVRYLSLMGGNTPIGYIFANFLIFMYGFMLLRMLFLAPFFIEVKDGRVRFSMRNWTKLWVNLSVFIYASIFGISGYSYLKDPSSFIRSHNTNYSFVVPLTTDMDYLIDHLLNYDMSQKVGKKKSLLKE